MTGGHEQRFKLLHRKAGLSEHYASDLDLVFVDKHPKRISAFIDFKHKDEHIKFTQSIIFPQLTDIAPVFIIRSETDIEDVDQTNHRFTISEFIETVDSKQQPPDVKTEVIAKNLSWGGLITHGSRMRFFTEGGDGLIGWEHKLRQLNTPASETNEEQVEVESEAEQSGLIQFLTDTNSA
jgi:hypothetical protein